MRLTIKTIQGLKPTDRRQEIKDDGCRGLYLFLQPSGVKIWKVLYSQRGRLRKVTLGRFPTLGLSDAREAARQIFQQLDTGVDPIEARRQAEAAAEEACGQTIAAIVQRYVADNQHLRSIREIENRLRPIVAVWGNRPIASIRRREIIELIDRVKAERGGAAACTWQTWLRRLFSWSVEKDLIEVSPAAGIRRPVPVVYRERTLADDELRRLWPACDVAGYPFGPFMRLLLLTGCRRSELAELLWSDIDLDRREIVIPGERYKNLKAHLVPLSTQAVTLIAALPH